MMMIVMLYMWMRIFCGLCKCSQSVRWTQACHKKLLLLFFFFIIIITTFHAAVGKATALSKADAAQPDDPDQPAAPDAVPDQATLDKEHEDDEWEPGPSTKRRAVTKSGTRNAPAQRRKGGGKRRAVESDSHDSDSAEEGQPGSSPAHGLRGKQRRQQLVIEDDDLQEDTGLDGSREDVLERPSSAAEEVNTAAVSPHSAVLSHDGMETNTDPHAGGSSSIPDQAVWPQPASDSVGLQHQPADGAYTVEAIHSSQPAGTVADQGRASFSLLDAMLHPDDNTSYHASGTAKPPSVPQHGHPDDKQHPSHGGAQVDNAAGGSVQPLPELANQAAPVAEAPPSSMLSAARPAVKGRLRDRVKAFAALRK